MMIVDEFHRWLNEDSLSRHAAIIGTLFSVSKRDKFVEKEKADSKHAPLFIGECPTGVAIGNKLNFS